LYDKWRERFPDSTETLKDIKDVVTDGGRLAADGEPDEEDSSAGIYRSKDEISAPVEDTVSSAVPDDSSATVQEDGGDEFGGDEPYQCHEQPEMKTSLPKDKWICEHHYIHVFYDDEDKVGITT
jgi:hypothetical protein